MSHEYEVSQGGLAALSAIFQERKMVLYTLDRLRLLNTAFEDKRKLEQGDVDRVNRFVKLIESTREDCPCLGDIVEYTDEYGKYSHNAHIRDFNSETGRFAIYAVPHIPFVFQEDNWHGVHFWAGGGPEAFVEAATLTYIGKREKLFELFDHDPAHGSGGIYFKAEVNVWEYIAPEQKHPGYSTKNWEQQYISYRENPVDGCVYRYYGQNIAFKDNTEYLLWKKTYKGVEFKGADSNHFVVFHYREQDVLVSREDWDALDLPLDTRFINGPSLSHVKVAYDDAAHVVTVYRFTNSGYLDPRRFGPYEKAKGTALFAPSEVETKDYSWVARLGRKG